MSQSRLTDAQERFLLDLFGQADCLVSAEATHVFGSDASRRFARPLAVVRPTSEEQVVKLMGFIQREGLPVVVRGRATNVVGACIPDPPAVVVSTLKMNRVLEISPEDFIARVEPGVIVGKLQAELAKQGLFYPPDPASVNMATIGGTVATCAGGMRAVKYGVTREYVLGLRVVLPGGEILRTGARTHKNVVGLDLTRLIVGSEGTLGVTTEITLKLLPKPAATATLVTAWPDSETALAAAQAIFAGGMLPTALEFLDKTTLTALSRLKALPWPETAGAALFTLVDGSEAAAAGDLARLKTLLGGLNPLWSAEALGREAEEPLWEIRRSINPASFQIKPDKLSDDVTVPRGRALELVRFVHELSGTSGAPVLVFGHLGDGNLHVNVMYDKRAPEESRVAAEVKNAVQDKALELGGVLSGEHGIGCVKTPSLGKQLDKKAPAVMRSIKAVFDPNNLMNPGKAY